MPEQTSFISVKYIRWLVALQKWQEYALLPVITCIFINRCTLLRYLMLWRFFHCENQPLEHTHFIERSSSSLNSSGLAFSILPLIRILLTLAVFNMIKLKLHSKWLIPRFFHSKHWISKDGSKQWVSKASKQQLSNNQKHLLANIKIYAHSWLTLMVISVHARKFLEILFKLAGISLQIFVLVTIQMAKFVISGFELGGHCIKLCTLLCSINSHSYYNAVLKFSFCFTRSP